MKSWTLTSSGLSWGRHSRPAFLTLPTNSFFLVSTETTGWPSFRKDAARVDVLKLRVSIHMLVAFAGFAVRLQAIARLLQKLAHHGVADLMSFVRQLFAQLAQTARSP